MIICGEMMNIMLKTVLPSLMRMSTSVDNRSASTARRSAGKRHIKHGAISCQCI